MAEPARKAEELTGSLNGVAVVPHLTGALYVPEFSALLVADLHLEKGSAYAASGQLLPPYDTRKTIGRLAEAIAHFLPETVIALGDSFHDLGADNRIHDADADRLAALVRSVSEWVWIEGNHDPQPPARFGGITRPDMTLGGLVLRHEPVPGAAPGEVCGHLHPAAKVVGRSRRLRCFATDGARMILPAFGAYAGGLSVRDEAIKSVFGRCPDAWVIGRDAIYPVPAKRLVG
ncbi:ligase-associated DNA damage response endonuclease PdeM [Hyphobacterium sp. HN65]|uniref:Ligase-associated DNA damage response endonuclease PdeM n=1 Tax=Hyphobacterium lacteum TaxID=3116575 RepID=A0ABU7LNB5_9PROT|nr:ligase-associated DNA damage response endonuclease PdeM [Hyphobacterium sp. HN65]MEE2525411.1 ligase-associated DNA damage response endonuclease PdeM [Hyphobacterium sp. HN65]